VIELDGKFSGPKTDAWKGSYQHSWICLEEVSAEWVAVFTRFRFFAQSLSGTIPAVFPQSGLEHFQNSGRLLGHHTREIVQELLKPVPHFKIIDQGLNRDTRACKNWRATEDIGRPLDELNLSHSSC